MRVSKKLRRERLLTLAHALIDTDDERFDMHHWGRHVGDHKPAAKNFCGTSACALGTAALIPKFKREGLRIDWLELEEDADGNKIYDANVLYGRHEGEHAGAAFFGLTREEAHALFLDTGASRSDTVAKLLLLADGQEITGPML